MLSHSFMRRCLELAQLGRGKTGMNPMVGSVLVRDGKIVAEGFHSEFGKAHAERDLVENTDPTSSASGGLRGASTLYVNLEPCCHRNKKTPPCTDLIIQSGIKKLVYGMRDPNPAVSGKGIDVLRKADIEVIGPVLEDECLRLNRGFVSLQNNHRPWITLKIARTVDGKIANDDRSMMKITSEQQNAWSHEFLRARHDAILVGVRTILTDDSRLTVRSHMLTPSPRPLSPTLSPMIVGKGAQPYRIILDSQLRIPLASNVMSDLHASKTIIVCSPDVASKRRSDIESRGVRVLQCPIAVGIFDWTVLWKLLMTPVVGCHGISSILVEGGPKTWETFRKADLVDEEVTLMGPVNALRGRRKSLTLLQLYGNLRNQEGRRE